MQAMMTLNTLKVADAKTVIKTVLDGNPLKGPKLVANTIVNGPAGGGRGGGLDGLGAATLSPAETESIAKGEEIYKTICFACHGDDGRGEPNPGTSGTKAPPLAASPRVLGHQEYVIKTLLHGLTGPVGGNTYTEVMIPMGQNNDEWVAAIGSYIRNAFGNRAPTIKASDVARVRAANASRKTSWVSADLEAGLPKQLPADTSWKLTASHNTAIASYALSIQPWTSGVAQAPGMWLQIELPQPATITEIQFESSAAAINAEPIVPGAPPRTGLGGGGGGRGAAPGAAPAPAPPAPPVGYPRGYQIQVSMDGTTWGRPVAQGASTGSSTDITFAPTRAKFVRLTLTAAAPDAPVTIQKLKLYEPGTAATAK
jgi:mono/diheme cytochrome c family protein